MAVDDEYSRVGNRSGASTEYQKSSLMNNQALEWVHQQQDLFLKTAYLLQLIRIKRILSRLRKVWSANLRFK